MYRLREDSPLIDRGVDPAGLDIEPAERDFFDSPRRVERRRTWACTSCDESLLSRTVQESELLRFMRDVTRTHDLELSNFSFELGDDRVLDLTLEFLREQSDAELTGLASKLRAAFALSRSGPTHRIGRVRQVVPDHFWQDWRRRVVAGMRPPQVKDRVLSTRAHVRGALSDSARGSESCNHAT